MNLSDAENKFKDKLRILKRESGLHSPSVNEIEFVLNTNIKIDACFLCNPYSQELAYRWLDKDIKKQLQHYPPSNSFLAKHIGTWRGLDSSKIIVGNGAMELIYSLLNTIKQRKIVIPIPSFSTYYELLEKDNQISYFQLFANNDYRIDVYSFIEFIQRENPDYVILINPSNPSGQILYPEDIKLIHSLLKPNQILIVDESFIDFADLNASIESYASNQDNIVIIRSLSKDFGLAGWRLGYSLMPYRIKEELTASSVLWNINGLASIFCTYLSNEKFILEYNKCKLRYIEDKKAFYSQLYKLPIKVYSSSANFFLIKPEVLAEDLFVRLLYKYGIYSRLLNDKIGLDKNYLRIASKTGIENKKIINALNNELQ